MVTGKRIESTTTEDEEVTGELQDLEFLSRLRSIDEEKQSILINYLFYLFGNQKTFSPSQAASLCSEA